MLFTMGRKTLCDLALPTSLSTLLLHLCCSSLTGLPSGSHTSSSLRAFGEAASCVRNTNPHLLRMIHNLFALFTPAHPADLTVSLGKPFFTSCPLHSIYTVCNYIFVRLFHDSLPPPGAIEKTYREMRVPQRAVPSAPRVWAPKGACAFEIQSSPFSLFIFCTNIKMDSGPPRILQLPSQSRQLPDHPRDAPGSPVICPEPAP